MFGGGKKTICPLLNVAGKSLNSSYAVRITPRSACTGTSSRRFTHLLALECQVGRFTSSQSQALKSNHITSHHIIPSVIHAWQFSDIKLSLSLLLWLLPLLAQVNAAALVNPIKGSFEMQMSISEQPGDTISAATTNQKPKSRIASSSSTFLECILGELEDDGR